MSKEVIVLRRGEGDCKHEWVYDLNSICLTTNPPITINKKICKHCGMLVEERIRSEIHDEFNEINNKFL